MIALLTRIEREECAELEVSFEQLPPWPDYQLTPWFRQAQWPQCARWRLATSLLSVKRIWRSVFTIVGCTPLLEVGSSDEDDQYANNRFTSGCLLNLEKVS